MVFAELATVFTDAPTDGLDPRFALGVLLLREPPCKPGIPVGLLLDPRDLLGSLGLLLAVRTENLIRV